MRLRRGPSVGDEHDAMEKRLPPLAERLDADFQRPMRNDPEDVDGEAGDQEAFVERT
jgi:hypothetical protein